MQTIAIQAVPDQTLSLVLGRQNCQIHLFQKGSSVFVDLLSNGLSIIRTRIARNGVPLVRHKYLGFAGDLMFIDMRGTNDPVYQDLSTRYKLVYLEAYEI